MNSMEVNLRYLPANESDLNEILVGQNQSWATSWPNHHGNNFVRDGQIGVLLVESEMGRTAFRPVALVVPDQERRRLFGRFAQVRTDLSPMSAWAHIISPKQFENLDSATRRADFHGFEAAWAGLAVAEALLLAERPVSKLKVTACFATQTFAVARSVGLWSNAALPDVLAKFDAAQRIFRVRDSALTRLREVMMPIWTSLISASHETVIRNRSNVLSNCFAALLNTRQNSYPDEADAIARELSIPESSLLYELPRLTPESRVAEFDKIIAKLSGVRRQRADAEYQSLVFLAGYLTTIVAGGSASLSLAEKISNEWPEITALAYVIGSIGERVVWSASFDGLGRLVSRELSRPLRLDEPPTSDISLDEAEILVDRQLSDPLVHLRIKQARTVSVSLLPGVNIFVSLADVPSDRRGFSEPNRGFEGATSPANLDDFVEVLWPFIEKRMRTTERSKSKSGKKAEQRKLPLER